MHAKSDPLMVSSNPKFPPAVTAAGVVWIAVGGQLLLNLLLLVVQIAAEPNITTRSSDANLVCLLVFVVAVALVHAGVQSVRRTARGTIQNGVGSIILGLLFCGGGLTEFWDGGLVLASFALLCGVALIAAGVLACCGRRDHKMWRKAQRAGRER